MWEMNFGKLIVSGGPIMIPVILCSICALWIILTKLLYFSSINVNAGRLMPEIFDLVKQNRLKEAVARCDLTRSPLAKILRTGIIKFGEPRESIKEAMENAARLEIPYLEERLPALATIANVSPLLGLLGTVAGMASSFYAIQTQTGGLAVTPGDFAGGIWEALLTTVFGLMVAIPAYVAYNYLVGQVNNYIVEMERGSNEFLNFISHLAETAHEKGQDET